MPSSLCALSKPSVSLLLAVSIVSLGFGQWIEQLPREFKDSILWSADHEEGDLSDWTMSLGKDPGGGILNTGDPDVIAQATNTQRHSGKYSAQATIQEAVQAQNGSRAVRFMRWSNKPYDLGGTEFPGEAYYSTWMFLDETYNPNKYAPWDPGDGGWWIVFQFKAHDEQGESQPTWMLNIRHDDTTKRMFLYLYSPVNSPASIQQDLVAVPVGRWFHVEAFCKVSVKNEGRLTIWQDGKQILDAPHVRTVLTSENHNVVWGVGNYTDHIASRSSVGTATLFFDDALVSTKPVSSFLAPVNEKKP